MASGVVSYLWILFSSLISTASSQNVLRFWVLQRLLRLCVREGNSTKLSKLNIGGKPIFRYIWETGVVDIVDLLFAYVLNWTNTLHLYIAFACAVKAKLFCW